jgi:hypothetical protein
MKIFEIVGRLFCIVCTVSRAYDYIAEIQDKINTDQNSFYIGWIAYECKMIGK